MYYLIFKSGNFRLPLVKTCFTLHDCLQFCNKLSCLQVPKALVGVTAHFLKVRVCLLSKQWWTVRTPPRDMPYNFSEDAMGQGE